MSANVKEFYNPSNIDPKHYTCGFCNSQVGSSLGYYSRMSPSSKIYICPTCGNPSYFINDQQHPGIKFGTDVQHLPDDIRQAYEEARSCFSVSAFTASALICRKILMNVAVDKGADENKSFAHYVNWLRNNNYIPPNSTDWVDHIRTIGNQGTHEISPISKEEAEELITFSEMLLRILYEFNARMTNRPSDE